MKRKQNKEPELMNVETIAKLSRSMQKIRVAAQLIWSREAPDLPIVTGVAKRDGTYWTDSVSDLRAWPTMELILQKPQRVAFSFFPPCLLLQFIGYEPAQVVLAPPGICLPTRRH